MRTLFLVPVGSKVGLTAVTLGFIRALENLGFKVGFLKPVAQQYDHALHNDYSSLLVQKIGNYQCFDSIPIEKVSYYLSHNKQDILTESLVELYEVARKNVDILVIEGVVPTEEIPYADSINRLLKQSLNAEVILIASEKELDKQGTYEKSSISPKILEEIEISATYMNGANHAQVLGYVINRLSTLAKDTLYKGFNASDHKAINEQYGVRDNELPLLGAIAFKPSLSAQRTIDVARYLNASIMNEGHMYTRRVLDYTVCASRPEHMMSYLTPGNLIITPGDRDDIIITSCMAALNGIPLAGLLLTGGIRPANPIIELCHKALLDGLPVLTVNTNSYQTATLLDQMTNHIAIDDAARIEDVVTTVSESLNLSLLKQLCIRSSKDRLTPAAFRYNLVQRAKASQHKKIVLPEGEELRTIQAAIICKERGIADCVLLGRKEVIYQLAGPHNAHWLDQICILLPEAIRKKYILPMVALRAHKGLNQPMAEAQLEDEVVLGTMMLAEGDVDGLVSGAVHSTANTIRPAFQLIKTNAQSGGLVSSIFFMLLADQVLVYGDCAVNPNPDAKKLAYIAIQSADSAALFGIEPKVAMISYSTGSSGIGSDVEKVKQAVEYVRQLRPDIVVDGPLQYDAAFVETVAKSKAPKSSVAGHANVFIFPDLNTGNTTYKAVQRSDNIMSIGPMLQGLNKPVNDLSRGAFVDDIVYTIALTVLQANGLS